MKHFFLQPGALFYSSESVDVITVLGSCVSVCVYDKYLKTGGMCHYYLPYRLKLGEPPDRYGDAAIPNLLRQFKEGGSKPENLSAKVLGGGRVLPDHEAKTGNVGVENVRLAKKLLSQFNIPVVGHSTGGTRGRKVRFNTYTGRVEQKIFSKKNNAEASASDKKINVMIVDDSKTIRKIMKSLIEKDPAFFVLHEAENPVVAQKLISPKKPDVITLDIEMPVMDGVTFLSHYMKKDPIPTVIVTSLNYNNSGPVLKALELGAVDYFKKPTFDKIESLSKELHEKLKNAYSQKQSIALKVKPTVQEPTPTFTSNKKEKYLVAIGASTGGTEAIKELLLGLPVDIPPIVIVLHIPPIFSKAYAKRLNALCPFEVKEANDGDDIIGGRVLLAPGGMQMKIVKRQEVLKIRLTDDAPVNSFKPSVDFLFNSLLDLKSKVIGVLLTGMGKDGAAGLLGLKRCRSMTIAQDEASSAVYGMPKVAKEMGAAVKIASLQSIPRHIVKHMGWCLRKPTLG